MPYTPSLDDLPSASAGTTANATQGYTPSIDDLPPDNSSQSSSMFLNAFGNNSPVANFATGVSSGLGNTYLNTLNLLPGVNVPTMQRPQGVASNIGNMVGQTAGFIGGGEILDSLRAASEAIPYLGNAASALGQSSYLSTLARQALGTGLYGAANDPQNRLMGLGAGILGGSAGATVGAAMNPLGNYIASKLMPQKQASDILDRISGGSFGQIGSLENTQQDLASQINKAATNQTKISDQMYQPVFDAVGNKTIYRVNQEPQYWNLPDNVFDSFSNKTSTLHDNFMQNSTFQNAHELKSQLGSDIRYAEKRQSMGNLDQAGVNQLDSLYQAQNALGNDMNLFLSRQPKPIQTQYNAAQANYAQNVVPFYSSPALSKISDGVETNPDNLTSIFSNPDKNTNAVMSKLDPYAGDQLTYLNLGKVGASKSPESLANAMKMLDQQGLSSYMSPQLRYSASNLQKSISNRDNLQRGIGLLGGALLGNQLGEGAGTIAALGGAYLAPAIGRIASTLVPKSAADAAQGSAYPFLQNTILANTLGANNQ